MKDDRFNSDCPNQAEQKEKALAYFRENMRVLIEVISGRQKGTGSQKDLDEAISNFYKIIPYLKKLDPNSIAYKDVFLEIAVEGGRYCALGINRASGELIRDVLRAPTGPDDDPVIAFEKNIEGALQAKREEILQGLFNELITTINLEKILRPTDNHVFNEYRACYGFGFVPFTKFEQNSSSVSLHIIRKFGLLTPILFSKYQNALHDAFYNQRTQFIEYIRGKINNNPNLEKAQKKALIELFREGDHQEGFERLMLVMLGVLKKPIL